MSENPNPEDMAYWIPGVGRRRKSEISPEQWEAREQVLGLPRPVDQAKPKAKRRRPAGETSEPYTPARIPQDVIVELLSFEAGIFAELNAGDPEWSELLDKLADWLHEARGDLAL